MHIFIFPRLLVTVGVVHVHISLKHVYMYVYMYIHVLQKALSGIHYVTVYVAIHMT